MWQGREAAKSGPSELHGGYKEVSSYNTKGESSQTVEAHAFNPSNPGSR